MKCYRTSAQIVWAVLVVSIWSPLRAQIPRRYASQRATDSSRGSSNGIWGSDPTRSAPLATGGGGGGGGTGPPSTIGGIDISRKFAFRPFSLPGNDVSTFSANAIDAYGNIVGSYCTSPSCVTSHGFVLAGNSRRTLDFPGAPLNSPQGINDSGKVVGWYWDSAFLSTHGAVYPSSSIDLCGFNQQTRFFGVNQQGEIAATCGFENGYILTNSGLITIPPSIFPNILEVSIRGLNASEQYVGYGTDFSATDHGIIGDLTVGPSQVDFPGALSTQILGISDSGEALGQASDSSTSHGFICTLPVNQDCFKWFDVITNGVRAGYTQPAAINSHGEIIGQYVDATGAHAFDAIPFTTSYYVESTNPLTLVGMGHDTAIDQLSAGGGAEGIVALLFGAPTANAAGTYGATVFHGNVPLSSISQLVEDFVAGYYNALGANHHAHLRVVVTTSNSTTRSGGNQVTFQHGRAWAQMISSIATWIVNQGYSSQVDIAAGNDIEFSDERRPDGTLQWAGPSSVQSWVDGYSSVFPQHFLYDVGDAGGCPRGGTTPVPGSCAGGWSQETAWYVAWGSGPALPLPQIYRPDGVMADQWANLSLFSYLAHGQPMIIAGLLTNTQACHQLGSGCSPTIDNDPGMGWQQISDRLNDNPSTGQHVALVTDIKYGARR